MQVLLSFRILFFASPKKKQKKSPEKDYIPFSGSSYVELEYYCGFGISALVGVPNLSRKPTLKPFRRRRHAASIAAAWVSTSGVAYA